MYLKAYESRYKSVEPVRERSRVLPCVLTRKFSKHALSRTNFSAENDV